MPEKFDLEMISRRRVFSILGLAAAFGLVSPILGPSDAEAQTAGTERRQERRTERTDRRQARRTGRTVRRTKRRKGRTERRTKRRTDSSPKTPAPQ